MDEVMDDIGDTNDTPLEAASETSSYDKQKAMLTTYLDSLPYPTESVDEMTKVLEDIVGKILICVQTRNFLVLCQWDGLLQWYV